MNSPQRIKLTIDVFEQPGQQVEVWSSLKPSELIAAALAEFGEELPYIGNDPQRFRLVRVGAGPLRDTDRLKEGDHLCLEEIPHPRPEGAGPAPQAIYLRDQEHGTVYPLPWLPAIIGRFDRQHREPLLAVNLGGLPTGSRVSRRHARIGWDGQAVTIEQLSDNPTSIRLALDGSVQSLDAPVALRDGDRIILQQSQIELLCIIREHKERSKA